MSARWNSASLLEPISPEEPCGKSLEDTDALNLLDSFQIFGQSTLDPEKLAPGEKPAPARKEARKSDRPPNWQEVQDLSIEMLGWSKDLRILAHLAASVLRTDGAQPFFQLLGVANEWIKAYWGQVYPLIEDDAIFRRNALNCLTDRPAVIDGLRRAPLVSSRQHGRFSLRDLEVASGAAQPVDDQPQPGEAQIAAAFAEIPIDDLRALRTGAAEAEAALRAIDEKVRGEAGIEAAPEFEPLLAVIKQLGSALQVRLASHPAASPADAGEGAAEGDGAVGGGAIAVGAIKSRQDAIRALDAAAEFFRRNEPTSPVPLLVDRAKRLVGKDFLEVLADVAPDAVAQAKAAGGIRE
jgi:type VI secretion system protein ImpA